MSLISNSKNIVGRKGEEIAKDFLKKSGYMILEKNFRTKIGEIDLICFDKKTQTLVFIEVKTRRSSHYGTPEMAVNIKKQKQIIKSALVYIKKNGIKNMNIQFDVVSIVTDNENPEINLFKNAFHAEGYMI